MNDTLVHANMSYHRQLNAFNFSSSPLKCLFDNIFVDKVDISVKNHVNVEACICVNDLLLVFQLTNPTFSPLNPFSVLNRKT